MDDRNQTPFPRQPQPDEQSSTAPEQNNDPWSQPQRQSDLQEQPTPVPLVPDEYEPATERSEYAPASPDQTPSSQPAFTPADMQVAQPQYEFTPPVKKSRKGLIIGIVAAVIAVLLIGGAAAAYKFWYQNPDKVLADAFTGVIKAKTVSGIGKMVYTSDKGNVDITINHLSAQNEGKTEVTMTLAIKDPKISVSLSGDGIYTKNGDFYVRVKDLEKLYESVIDQLVNLASSELSYGQTVTPEEKQMYKKLADSIVKPIIQKIDNRWIVITKSDVENISKDASDTYDCVQKAYMDINNDPQKQKEITDAYKNNRFVVVKQELGSKNGSLGYLLDIDKQKSKDFGKAMDNTSIAKELNKCGDGSGGSKDDITSSSDTDLNNTRFEVWVDRWSHQVTNVHVTGDAQDDNGKLTLDYSPKLNVPVSVEAPKDTVTVDTLQKELEQASQKAMEQLYGSFDSSTSLNSGVSSSTTPQT